MSILSKALTYTYLVLSIALFLISCVAPFLQPSDSALVYYAGLAFPILAVNMIFVILGLMISFKKWWALLFLVPVLWFGSDHLSVLDLSDKKSAGQGIKVVSFNAFFQKIIKQNQGELSRWKKFIANRNTRPDILCIQEFKGQFDQMIDDASDFNLFPDGVSYLKIASRYPILDGGHLKNEAERIVAIWADLKIGQENIRVYNVHLSSNSVSVILGKSDSDQEGPEMKTDKVLEKGKWMYRQILEKAQIRNEEAAFIKSHIDGSPYPVVLSGDFNETPQTHTYHLLKGELKDSFRGADFGIHSTYVDNPKGIRIDYVFVPQEWKVRSHYIIPYHLSDHKPVFTEIVMP